MIVIDAVKMVSGLPESGQKESVFLICD